MASDERRDVAALRISAAGLPVLPFGNSASAASGAVVFCRIECRRLPWTASSGILSASEWRRCTGAAVVTPILTVHRSVVAGIQRQCGDWRLGYRNSWDTQRRPEHQLRPLRTKACASQWHRWDAFWTLGEITSFGGKDTFRLLLPNAPGSAIVPPIRLCLPDQRQQQPFRCISKTIICAARGLQDTFIRQRFPALGLRSPFGQTADMRLR